MFQHDLSPLIFPLLKVFYSLCVKDIKDYHPFTSHLSLSLRVKYISYKQHEIGSCFLIQSENLYLLIGLFAFTLNLIIYMTGFKCIIFLFMFYLSYIFPSVFPFLYSFTLKCSIFYMHLLSPVAITSFFFIICSRNYNMHSITPILN